MFFSKPTSEQAVALAAVFHACELVSQLANTGEASSDEMSLCMSALLNQNPDSLSQIYGPVSGLKLGMDSMERLFSDGSEETKKDSGEILRYVVSILYLARKLSSDKGMLDKIATGIENAERQSQHFSITHDNVYANIASLYQDTVSTLRLRIQVSGSSGYLQQPAVAERIRCLLFSAIRSAFLWQQLGGKRIHLAFYRKQLAKLLPAR
ncbi:MAG: high frequency lysogenization protein HflD [Porticoccaceae bacterium]|jgi:high frequency lysogenization protein|tara:strand:+ start:2997 stop:3623 length:627 start_codon:yes stop_codon:yes gene_type:complete